MGRCLAGLCSDLVRDCLEALRGTDVTQRCRDQHQRRTSKRESRMGYPIAAWAFSATVRRSTL
jgi:hypothetical protein